jgi:hypothetical protein
MASAPNHKLMPTLRKIFNVDSFTLYSIKCEIRGDGNNNFTKKKLGCHFTIHKLVIARVVNGSAISKHPI